jgi:hypothetical protein
MRQSADEFAHIKNSTPVTRSIFSIADVLRKSGANVYFGWFSASLIAGHDA